MPGAVLAATLSCVASTGQAHAPLARQLAISPLGRGELVVRMPGFGFLVRGPQTLEGQSALGYACDALLGVSPQAIHTPMAYGADGDLLIGTENGLVTLSPGGCPGGNKALAGLSVLAVAVHSQHPDHMYAITAQLDAPPKLHHSQEAGSSWTMASQLPAYPVTALVLDPSDPLQLYVSQTTPAHSTSIGISSDAGESFQIIEVDRELTLLGAQAQRLWAMARVPDAPVGVVILRASQAEGPWQELLTVNFFGGFAIDPSDANLIWVGDEARGVFRSSDGGDSFEETQPSIAAASLSYGAQRLWATTPGLPEQTALLASQDAVEAFDPVLALRDVDRLVDCSPELDVAQVCAPAWIEWQRDVLGRDLPSDAGVDASTQDAATEPVDASHDPASGDSGSQGHADSGALEGGPASASSNRGCCVARPRGSWPSPGWPLASLALLGWARRIGRRR